MATKKPTNQLSKKIRMRNDNSREKTVNKLVISMQLNKQASKAFRTFLLSIEPNARESILNSLAALSFSDLEEAKNDRTKLFHPDKAKSDEYEWRFLQHKIDYINEYNELQKISDSLERSFSERDFAARWRLNKPVNPNIKINPTLPKDAYFYDPLSFIKPISINDLTTGRSIEAFTSKLCKEVAASAPASTDGKTDILLLGINLHLFKNWTAFSIDKYLEDLLSANVGKVRKSYAKQFPEDLDKYLFVFKKDKKYKSPSELMAAFLGVSVSKLKSADVKRASEWRKRALAQADICIERAPFNFFQIGKSRRK